MGTQFVAAIKANIDRILEIDKASLVSRPAWGNIRFDAAAQSHKSIYEIIEILSGLPYERLPDPAAAQIDNALDRVFVWLQKNNEFAIETGNPSGERDQIVQSLASHEQDLYQNTQQWIPFLAYLKGDIPKQLDQIQTLAMVAGKRSEDFASWLKDRQVEFEKIIQATREASAKAGVAVFTKDFSDESKARDLEATSWLRYSLIAAGLTLLAAIVFYFVPPPLDMPTLIQHSTSKIIILSILIAATAWCAGNYKANKHQATVSRHKAHALTTFQAFVLASDDPSVRDAVLLETTRAIFAHNQTGYLRSDGTSEPSSRVVEIIKGGVNSTHVQS